MSDTPTIQEQCYGTCWAASNRIEELERELAEVRRESEERNQQWAAKSIYASQLEQDLAKANKVPVAVVYTDDGPSGPGGQDCMTTSAWTRVFLFDDAESAITAMRDNKIECRRGRRWRATIVYPPGHPHHSYANSITKL